MREEHDIVQQIQNAQKDPQAADAFVRQYLPFIQAETAKFLKKPSSQMQDALSIAMFAFYEAMMAYRKERGAFLRLAAMAIRNRLIDDYRKAKRHEGVASLNQPIAGDADGSEMLDMLDSGEDAAQELVSRTAAKNEIADFSAQLLTFGLTLTDVAESCPKQDRTLAACISALEFAKKNPELLEQLVQSKKLPIARLALGAGVEKKTLERHRKYLVAILLAYTNGFEIIRGHLCQIGEKGGRMA